MKTYAVDATEYFKALLEDEQGYWYANADKNVDALDDGIRSLFRRLVTRPWTGQKMEDQPDEIRSMKLEYTQHRVAYHIDSENAQVTLLGVWGLAERRPRFSKDK